jgi:hypothetical protein
MTRFVKVLTLTMVGMSCLGIADAIEPTHYGQFGNPEEPAMRPVKAVWKGLISIKHNVKKSAREGHEKVQIIGAIEATRGLRRGFVELVANTVNGMAGTYPRDPKKMGKANETIENDPLLQTASDTAAGAAVAGIPGGASAAVVGGAVTLCAQEATDRIPKERAKRAERRRESELVLAQKRYIGDRAVVNKKPNGTGNLLKLAKK